VRIGAPLSLCAALLLVLSACGGGAGDDFDSALLLALSVFPIGADGKAASRPGAATLVILRRSGGEWSHEVLEDPESNVFHKALPFTPPGGRPGILTISGNAARLKLWRRSEGAWSAETLWAPAFGGKHDRLRDVELADLDGDGELEIALATHDQGVVAVVDFRGGEAVARELDRERDTFVHEVEVGDVDGDGEPEIYATPSQPNRFDGDPQTGRVTRYSPTADGGASVFADLGQRHAKEVLVADLDGEPGPEVYVAVEGRVENRELVERVEIRRDGTRELIAAPFRAGLWLLRPRPGTWARERFDANSSSFEHATAALDLDGDGADEVYVAADDQGEVRRYVWKEGRVHREVIFSVPPELNGFTWNVTAVPVALTR
jgi:hypothetical protein